MCMLIIYTDVEGLKLPYSELEWSDDIQTAEDVLNYENGDNGYFVEVDLGYPEHLHDLHSDYPLAPEKLKSIS